jgi:TrmH family RNA methyltransferase
MQHITSPHNARVAFLRSLHNAKGRAQARAWLAEGPHLLQEALRAHITPSLVLYDPDALAGTPLPDTIALLADEGAEAITAPSEIVARAADSQTPQGIVAAFARDDVALEKLRARRRGRLRPLVLVLDDLQDPGNVGTILRSALAADVDMALLTPHCADPFAPKVVRAASGAHFHLPIATDLSWDEIRRALAGAPAMRQIVVADSGASDEYFDLDLTQRTALIIGNEAHGPSPEARALATRRVRIPMFNGVESLNAAVAASVLLFESVRQRRARSRDT